MTLYTYRARNLSDALRLIRQELGPEASVLHTREVGSALSRLLGGRGIEVTASADLAAPRRLPETAVGAVHFEQDIHSRIGSQPTGIPGAELYDFRRQIQDDLFATSENEPSIVEQLACSSSGRDLLSHPQHVSPAPCPLSPVPCPLPPMTDHASELRRVARETALADASHDRGPGLLIVAGGKPGVGATTLAVNIAATLAADALRVVLLDANLERPQIAAECGLAGLFAIDDVLAGRKSIHEALQRGPGGVHILAGRASAEMRSSLDGRSIQRLLRQMTSLAPHADWIVADVGSQPSEIAARFWSAADRVLLVTSPDAVAVMDTYALVKTLLTRERLGRPLALVVNQVANWAVAADVHRRIDQSCRRFLGVSLDLAAALPFDPVDAISSGQDGPLMLEASGSLLAASVARLARQLVESQQSHPSQQRRAA